MQKKRILFICTGNAGRSQMAEAIYRHRYGDIFEIVSAVVAFARGAKIEWISYEQDNTELTALESAKISLCYLNEII
jgi:protein-tyrosine-phosphatase